MASTISAEQIDDLLYCARAGETDDLVAYLDEMVQASSSADQAAAKTKILEQALDDSKNGMLHYIAANGHLATFDLLVSYTTLPLLLHQNTSGNTPLHWAGLNGHLPLVKALVARIDELERLHPEEARKINVLKHEEEARLKKQQKQKQQQDEPPASTTDSTEEEEPERSLWDIRNTFGRGPTSESQMNEQEAVVQFLLTHMASGGQAEKPQASNERVEQEQETPTTTKSQEEEAGALSNKAASLSLADQKAGKADEEAVQTEQRELFGGAITTELPKGMVDASDLRQIPDNQEVLLSPDSDVTCILEVLESVKEAKSLEEAARFHFSSLAHDNSSQQSVVLSIDPPSSSSTSSSGPSTPAPILLRGLQRISKFNKEDSPVDTVLIHVAVWRLTPEKDVDLVLTLNEPLSTSEGERVAAEGVWKEEKGVQVGEVKVRGLFERAAKGLVVRDWGLFP